MAVGEKAQLYKDRAKTIPAGYKTKAEYVILSDGKSMQKFNEGYDGVNVVDGVAKSAILRGQTLVNIPTYTDAYITNTLDRTWVATFEKSKDLVKTNTKYYIGIFNDSDEDKVYGLRVDPFEGFQTNSQTTIKAKSYGYLIGTTISTITSTALIVNKAEHTMNNNVRILFLEFQEGMENWDIPYFEGMQSVKMPVLTTTGKNLWNNYHLERGSINHLNGADLNQYTTQTRSKDYIPIVPNIKYIATSYGFDGTTSSDLIRYYDSEKNLSEFRQMKNQLF